MKHRVSWPWVLIVAALVACAAATAGRGAPRGPVLQRPPGVRTYELVVTEQTRTEATFRLVFRLRTEAAGGESLEVLAAEVREGDRPFAPLDLDPGCVAAFGGGDGILGRSLAIPPPGQEDIGALAPPCVPEALFGALTDASTILLVQAEGRFGVERLRAEGDTARYREFHVRWSRPPALVEARIVSPGGTTRLQQSSSDTAVVAWEPDSMELAMVREVAPGVRAFLAGVERFGLELEIDPRSGVLRSARSTIDELELTAWAPFSDFRVPDRPPSAPGMPVRITRTLAFELLDE